MLFFLQRSFWLHTYIFYLTKNVEEVKAALKLYIVISVITVFIILIKFYLFWILFMFHSKYPFDWNVGVRILIEIKYHLYIDFSLSGIYQFLYKWLFCQSSGVWRLHRPEMEPSICKDSFVGHVCKPIAELKIY